MPTISSTIIATSGDAVTVTSADPVVDLTETGGILATDGYGIRVDLEATPYSASISVDGIVSTFASGIWFIFNSGSVSIGEGGVVRSSNAFGILVTSGAPDGLDISNAGQVIGSTAISLGDAADSISNSGTIRGLFGTAVQAEGGNDTVTNSGRIVGDVLLGDGNDRFIARSGGTVEGTINGGAGNDKYRIVDNALTLADDSGIDKILSTVSHTLGADFENLKLLGANALNGTGNASQNLIAGNKGDNRLQGLAGDDTLLGGKGADRLLGGGGNDRLDGGRGKDVYNGGNGSDTFVFSSGSGKDKIKDFDASSGAEDVDLSGMTSITSFSDLKNNHMSQFGGDVVINGGGGDKLTLVGIDIADLNANDFLF